MTLPDLPRRLAIAQMAMAWTTADNTRSVLQQLGLAAQAGAALVVFPELAITGFHREIRREAQPAPVAAALAQVAAACAQHRIAAAVGAPAWIPGEPRPLNVHVLIDAHGQVQAQVAKIGLTPSEATFFAPGTAPRPVATLAGWRCSSVLCREVEDDQALAAQLPPGRADLLLWPSLVGHDPALMAAHGWPDYLPLARAVARHSTAWLVQCNWPWALNTPESRHAGESAVIGPDGQLRLRLPRDAAGLAVFDLGDTRLDWLPQAEACHPGDSPTARPPA